jgi:hypothetical protein
MVTVTLTTVPKPLTLMFEGYGIAGPLSLMTIGVELVKLTGGQVGVGVAVGVGVDVGVAVAVTVAVGVGVNVAVAVGVGVNAAVAVGVGGG